MSKQGPAFDAGESELTIETDGVCSKDSYESKQCVCPLGWNEWVQLVVARSSIDLMKCVLTGIVLCGLLMGRD